MRINQVVDMNVVTYTRPIMRVIIETINVDVVTPSSGCLTGNLDEMGSAFGREACASVDIRSRHVEVT
ncbi:hypothetical protein D3C80_1860920 [compost metagenome]